MNDMRKIILQTRTGLDFIKDFTLAKLRKKAVRGFLNRTSVLLMMTALLLPLLIFQPLTTVSAKTSAPGLPVINSSAIYSEPPIPFDFSSPDTGGSFTPAAFSSLSTVAAKSYSSIIGFFIAPQLPEGFAAAKSVSPAYSFFTSISSSFGNIFGLFASSSAVEYMPPSSSSSVEFDYDGDGKADPAVWHQQSGTWKVKKSSDGSGITTAFGATAAFMTPGNFDGDSMTDYAVFGSGTFSIINSSTATVSSIMLGTAGDRPVIGDYDGDGKSDAAVFRPSNGTWIIQRSTAGYTTFQFGIASDILVPGDYDGDGKTDIAVFRPADQYWYIQGSSVGYFNMSWGLGTDLPVPADYDGDGKTDFAVWRPSTGTWYVLKSSGTGGAYIANAWGNYNDQPVPADYDGDGKTDFAVYRPKTGVWHIQKSSDGTYQPHTLGISTDKLVEAAYLKQNGSVAFDNTFARTRLAPRNATGGTNLYSQNFGWGTGLVGLPGRAGMDAGFGIGYNSLVWIKHNNTMVFDPDYSDAGPGFRMGFPTIEPIYYDGTTQKYTYLMVSPSGARTEFRQSIVSNVYETADSGYLQITANGASDPNDPAETVTLTVRGTDGTTMNYEFKGGAYRCSQIKDSNGNFITIGHDEYGLLKTVTDTLGRVITVTYNSNNLPIRITGQWLTNNGKDTAYIHTYATFEYATKTVNPGFAAGIGVYGPQGMTVGVLDKIIYGDAGNNTGATRFEYNNFGQVEKVINLAADGLPLNYVATNLNSPGTNLTDVPRLSQTRNWVKNFNGADGIPAETTVTNTFQENQPIWGDGQGTIVTVTTPDGVMQKSHMFGAGAGWTEALPYYTETCLNANCTGNDKKRWVITTWKQDDNNLTYIQNPRVTSTTVSDSGSSRRTAYTHKEIGGVAEFGLVEKVELFDEYNSGALLKRSTTDYETGTAYLSRRIIGLPKTITVEGRNDQTNAPELVSKIGYAYDGNDFTAEPNQIITPIRHDQTNYGANFIIGRGNLTQVSRYDVSNNTTVTSDIYYDIAGSTIAAITPDSNNSAGRKTTVSYADKFNDNNDSRNTFAYPTKLTDPAGKSSDVKYRFDIGANVWASSPTPNGAADGKISTRIYDTLGRLERQTVGAGGAIYTRYAYPASGVQSLVYSTVTEGAGEMTAESLTDGAGRTLFSRTEHPGSDGGWSATFYKYDYLGRVKSQSVPAEVDGGWNVTGDDAALLWTHQEYDWKGRVVRKINTDGNPLASSNASDVNISYDGCGCAGGQVTTVEGEEIIEKDWLGNVTNSLGRRTQKVYQDVLGRNFKSEILNWNDTLYSTSVTKFNGRDQAVSLTQTQTATSTDPADSQVTTLTYDGHGRMKTRKLPQQDAASVYNYNADDSISTMTDARGAMTNYTYNNRGLVTNVGYSAPNDPNNPGNPDPTIPIPAPVSFEYDDIGNRKKMTDGLGTVDYLYNDLSQMTSENRQFTDALANAPTNGYKLTYTYTLAGQLKSIKDPFDDQINYTHDKAGRLTSVDGAAAFGGVTNYAASPDYRAWGGLQSLTYGDGLTMTMSFNDRLQADSFRLTNATQTTVMDKSYEYYADGKLRKLDDKKNYTTTSGTYDVFDRTIKYDHVGRPTEGKSGAETRGTTVAPADMEAQLPYRQSYKFNAFGNLTQRLNTHWGVTSWYGKTNNLNYTYQNNRITNSGWQHDADGRVTQSSFPDDNITSTYDAAGRLTKLNSESNITQSYDGNSKVVKRATETYSEDQNGNGSWTTQNKYFIRSSVMGGQTVTEVDETGRKTRTIVRAAGAELAWQNAGYGSNEYVFFQHNDASGMSYRTARADGTVLDTNYTEGAPAELDPLGGNVGVFTPYFQLNTTPIEPAIPTLQNLNEWSPRGVDGQRVQMMMDGIEVPYWIGAAALANGSAVQCPNNYCGPQTAINSLGQTVLTSPFQAYAGGTSGYNVPQWGNTHMIVEGEQPDNTPEIIGWDFVEVASGGFSLLPTSWNPRRQTDTTTCDGLLDCLKKIVAEYKKQRDCDKYLANLFGDEGAYFFDNTFWKKDHATGIRRPDDDHSHLYGSERDSTVSTNIYIPAGGKIVPPNTTIPGSKYLGSSRDVFTSEGKQQINHNANYVLVQFKELGKLRNVTLAIFHVDNFKPEKQSGGRTRIGTVGFTRSEDYGSGGETKEGGGHSHFELMEGRKWNLSNQKLLSFRDICP